MIMVANFEKFLISPGFPLNFRKGCQIATNYLESSKSYGQNPLGSQKAPPCLNRVKCPEFYSKNRHIMFIFRIRLQLHGAIYRPDSFVLTQRCCANLKAIGYESTSLNRITADKSHRVIVA